jgi:predicted amidophosphoribosyltransferase
MTTLTICAACSNRRKEEHYLCRGCWFRLPPETCRRLRLTDHEARHRLFQLMSAIRRGVALEDITVSA